jgi:hypothetical protein
MAHPHSHLQLQLDPSDPNFTQEWRSWAFDTRSQMEELILASIDTIEKSNALIDQVDRVLARKKRLPRSGIAAVTQSH